MNVLYVEDLLQIYLRLIAVIMGFVMNVLLNFKVVLLRAHKY